MRLGYNIGAKRIYAGARQVVRNGIQLWHKYTNDSRDYSPQDNPGTLFTGRALDFDGVSDYVDANVGLMSEWTAVTWVKTTSTSINSIFYGEDGGVYGLRYASIYNDYVSWYTGDAYHNSETIANDGRWHRIGYIFDGTTWKIFIDGEIETTWTSGASAYELAKLQMIGTFNNSLRFFDGKLSNAQIWNSAWSADDVAYDFAHPEATPDDIARHSAGLSLSNCKAWYPLIEGNGSVVYDGSGNQNHGTITGATWASGLSGNPQTALMGQSRPMVFDGVDDGVDLNHHFNDVFSAGSWSMSAWVILSEGYAIDGMITDKYTGHKFEVLGSKLPKISIYMTSYYGVTGVTALNENELYHLTITYDGTTFKLYVNGALDNSNAESNKYHNDTGHNFEIGKAGDFGAGFFDGFIGDVTYWNTALDADEVSELYNSGTPLNALNHSQAENLVGYWRNDGDGTWVDRVGSNDGTVNGTPDVIMLPEGDNGRDSQGFFLTNPREASLNLAGDGYVEVEDDATLDITGALSLECWIKSSALDGDDGGLMSKCSDGVKYFGSNTDKSYSIGILNNVLYFQLSDGTNSRDCSGNIASEIDGNWHHIVATWDGTSNPNGMKIYIDGVLTFQNTATGLTSIQSLSSVFDIGGYTTQWEYNGSIDEPKVYNRALSLSEIKRNYRAGRASHANN